jgi:hypothetical protein
LHFCSCRLPVVDLPEVDWPRLSFAPATLKHKQPRLRERVSLEPALDLDNFRCRAVMDRIEVRFRIARPTQAASLHHRLKAITGVASPFIDPVGCSWLRMDCFDLTLQEPSAAVLSRVEEFLSGSFGFTSPAEIRLFEVSVDFWSNGASPTGKQRLIGLLQRCYLPQEDVWSTGRRPRFNAGPSARGRRFVLPKQDREHLFPEDLMAAPVDATFYLGERNGDWMVRLMHKTIDTQNPAIGTYVALPSEERRVRIEVVLQGAELASLGLRKPADLVGFKFVHLQGRYFRFMLPTFQGEAILTSLGMREAIHRWREQERLSIFLRAGIIGLEAKRRAREALSRKHRPEITALNKARGTRASRSPSLRRGKGVQADYVAYEALNCLVRRAFEHLAKREVTALRKRVK